jgi:hypothetical protein
MTKAAPRPVFRHGTQLALHRITVNVPQLLHELSVIADIDIVVTLLSEILGIADVPARHTLLQRFDGLGQCAKPTARSAADARAPA